MSVGYSCLWSVVKDDDKPSAHLEHSNCWASVFGSYSWGAKLSKGGSREGANTLYSWFRIDTKDINIPMSNYYLRNMIIPNIPDRCKDAIQIFRLFSKTYKAEVPQSKHCNVYEVSDPKAVIPWIKVKIDLTKITADDLFMLLTLLRNPQEMPYDIIPCVKLGQMFPITHNQAFIIGHQGYAGPSGHAALGSWLLLHMPTKEEIENFSLKDVWTKMRHNEEPWTENTNKQCVLNVAFQGWQKPQKPAGRYGHTGWGYYCPSEYRNAIDVNEKASAIIGCKINNLQVSMLEAIGVKLK